MRRAVPFAILLACLAVGVLPAFAADQQVNALSSRWSATDVAIKPGESVTWRNTSGIVHNLWIEGTQVQANGSSWTYGPRTFAERGTPYAFRCSIHLGMSGRVYVNASGTVPTPSPTPSPTATPYPTPSPTSTPTTTPGGSTPPPSGGSGPAVTSFRVRATSGRFCTRRSARCRKPGVFLRLSLGATEPVRVRGTLRRGSRRVRSVSLLARPGTRRVKLPGSALRPGRYALSLKARAITRRVRFSVRNP